LEASANILPDFLQEDIENKSPEDIENQKDGLSKAESNPFYGSITDPDKHRRDSQKKRMDSLLEKDEYTTLPGDNVAETTFTNNQAHMNNVPHPIQEEGVASLSHYLLSIVFMPHSLRILCLTNLFSWSAHVCYSLYFTDYVGEAVFEGDPKVSIDIDKI
jgi:solute carrier family 45 protein 1/2/4